MIRPLPSLQRCGRQACTQPYKPSGLTLCINWKRFMGVPSTLDHHIAPLLYTRTSSLPWVRMISLTMASTLWKSRTSTESAVACPPASAISRATVLTVDCWLFGSGGKGLHFEASEVVFAATTTAIFSTFASSSVSSRLPTCIAFCSKIDSHLPADAS